MTQFSELEPEFMRRVARIVWCTVATIDRAGNPRTRILHPIWEVGGGKPIGYIATGRHSFKEKHLARNPYVSLSYWDQAQEQVYVDAMQNARGKTIASVYSARAKSGATVSMPLSWKQIEKGVKISDSTIKNVPGLPAASVMWLKLAAAWLCDGSARTTNGTTEKSSCREAAPMSSPAPRMAKRSSHGLRANSSCSM